VTSRRKRTERQPSRNRPQTAVPSAKDGTTFEALIVRVVRACCQRPFLVLALAALATLGAVLFTYENFAINTDTSEFISSKLPWRQREIQLDAAFPQQVDTLLVVVDGKTPELAADAADRLGAALKGRDHVQAIYGEETNRFFDKNGLLYLSLDEVKTTTEQLIRAQPFLGTLSADPTLRGLAQALAFIPAGVKEGQISLKDFATPLANLSDAIDSILQGHPASISWSQLMTGETPAARELRRFIRVKPVLDYDDLEPGANASDTIRNTAAELGLVPDKGVTVRLTGQVAMADEEFASVADGALRNLLLTLSAVLLLLWIGLRSGRIIFAVVVCLLVGLALTAAAGLALVGSLNLISVAFAVLFVGIGVDFGIQVAVRYRRERHLNSDLQGALGAAASKIAKPLALAAAATAAGFFAFLPSDYIGISELGLIAGVGMIIAFITSLTLLPALLSSLRPPAEHHAIGYRGLAPIDRFTTRYRIPLLVAIAVLVLAGLPLFTQLKFDFNPINLRNSSVESVTTFLDLSKDPTTTPNVINVVAPSLSAANDLAQRLGKLPEVSETATLQSFVPSDQEQKLAVIADAADLLDPTLNVAETKPAPSDEETRKALSDAADAFQKLDQSQSSAVSANIANSLRALADANSEKRAAAEIALLSGLKLRLQQIRSSLHPQRVTLDNLPRELTEDWIAKDGRARVEVRPSGNQNDNETMARFASAVLKVTPDATGMPILIQESAKTIVRAFIYAVALALLCITVLLFIVLRSTRDVLLTLVPLLIAGIVTLELTVLFGLPLNFANIIALPLLLGVGVAFKIYYVLAWREGETNLLSSALTRAVFFSALTTATAFASLWLSNHPGTSSMGKLLSLSLLTTFVAAVLIQPILMGPPRQAKTG
jgi:hopanoid biosynthesis associated RND transporter like protein HpnN